MLTTEEEATIKWCPHGILNGAGDASVNRDPYDRGLTRCVGSQCMSWRWVKDPLVSFVTNGQQDNTRTEYGYCGLAGKP